MHTKIIFVKTFICSVLVVGIIFFAHSVFADSASTGGLTPDTLTNMKAKVLSVSNDHMEALPGGNGGQVEVQDLKAVVLDGVDQGKEILVNDDYMPLKVGSVFYVQHDVDPLNGYDHYQITDVYRLPVVFTFVILFIVCVILFGGIQGIRGLVSLLGSFVLIFKVLLPGILHGISPIWLTLLVCSLIIIIGSYITHGFNKTTSSAVIGMIGTVIFVGILAYIGVHAGHLSGFETDESTYLNINTGGVIDFPGLLLGGIMIGLLGVLYDVAIGQAVSVEELHKIAPHISRRIIYTRALRIGREHVGALVNTLAIAYVGVSLPILLLFMSGSSDGSNAWMTLNRDIFSSEIIRTMVGSIGLVLAVPITTLISTILLVHPKKSQDPEVIKEERHALLHAGHGHHH